MMTYQTRLFLAIGTMFLVLTLISAVALVITTITQTPKYPDIIAEQPTLKK